MPSNQYRDAVASSKEGTTWVCPRCDHPTVEYPAVSRRDNATAVCPKCGTEEAVRQHEGLNPWPTDDLWPFLASR